MLGASRTAVWLATTAPEQPALLMSGSKYVTTRFKIPDFIDSYPTYRYGKEQKHLQNKGILMMWTQKYMHVHFALLLR